MGCLVLLAVDDKNNRLAGDEDGRSGDTFPVSLSLDVEDGGVGGSENPENKKYNQTKRKKAILAAYGTLVMRYRLQNA